MLSNKYLPIDKMIVAEGAIFDFNLFLPTNSKNQIELFKDKNLPISTQDIIYVEGKKTLYVNEAEHEKYKKYLQNIMDVANSAEKNNLAKLHNIELIKETLDEAVAEDMNFEEKSELVYEGASEILDELFKNPETLGGYEKSKDVVNELVQCILDDNFTLKSLMSIAAHDYYTHTHSINVAIYSLSLGSYLKLDKNSLAELGESALLHDLGKSKIDTNIINKNGKLTEEEFKKMQSHPALGYSIGVKMGIKNQKVLNGIRHHHEKMDGSGYPYGYSEFEIPLYARIVGLCDIFDALTSRRSYKEPMSTFDAMKLMRIQMKNHIDLNLLNNMVSMFKA
jgi:HD-GYP domain-containing protein (c-di-GMP phosphodiesterase class II)